MSELANKDLSKNAVAGGKYPFATPIAWEGNRTWWQVKLSPESHLRTVEAADRPTALAAASH